MHTENIEQRRRLHSRGICVIIPTYNNSGTIRDVVTRCKMQCDDIIVVNDGCTDNTEEILHSIDGITIVSLRSNSGKGTALKEGFRKALSMGFSYAITLDADGQHYPEDIACLLDANIKNPGSLIIGERKDLEKQERSGGSKFANAFSNFWFFVQTWCLLKDTQTGYRLYPLKKLHGLCFLTSRYEAELELLVFAAWHGVKQVSVPVNVYYPPKEERVSHFRPIPDFTRITILNTILCVLACVYGLPLYLWRCAMTIFRTLYSLFCFLLFSMCFMTPLAILYVKLGRMTDKKRYGLHCLLCFMSRLVMVYHGIPGVKYKIQNPENEDFQKPSLIICNHQSYLDLMTLLMLHRKIVVLTNDWVWNSPFFSFVIRNAEFYPVSAGIENILPNLRSLVERGYSIAVYPEGTRSHDCRIGRFHKGAFHISQALGLDVLPLVLYGTGKVLPKKKYLMKKGIIRLDIDKRIPSEEVQKIGELKDRASWFRKYYRSRYQELCDEVEQNI